MSTYSEEIQTKLNNILEKTYDAEKGFKKAAEHAKSTDLKTFFKRKADERYSFGHDLKTEIVRYGQDFEKGGSTAGAMHRSWMDVKAWFSADNDEAMLEEAITGEKAAIDEYKEVLKEVSLPTSTTTLLTQQMNKISTDLNNIKRVEDAL
ncbi:ferritin-like domain-containing protein [Zobellia galactanivorans]|uniref:ferritin-like domain-containing protein n=1 Tax=Zobellia galactanivorans (strain DSM 12802 / CCUG 47099 / CIP 106680 / NCIMB 13871 / Dsij) TaxID=63186 RepID=UPI001C07CFF7|nr:PA2169 family four-helix-bundle protein [Zobellia galactanivorans]MBU3028372.1 PA2169 family four-helix-bundle protein [Zobellia galactanivorans]